MKTVVFIETNFSGLDAIQYCKHQGYRAVLVTDNFERFKKWFPASAMHKLDLADQVITVADSNDFDQVLAALRAQLSRIDALLTFAEIRTLVAARLCRALGLRGSNPEAIAIAQDKARFRQVLMTRGADDVRCRRIEHIDELPALAGALDFPCFLKPVQGHSSIGAVACPEAAAIPGIVESLRGISEDWISPAFVVEDCLRGELVSVEMLTTGPGRHQVVGVSDRDVVKDSIEIGASFPLQGAQREAIERKAMAALDAIGYDFGASHVEVMLTDSGPHLVEVNTRVGGSGHSVMLDLATARSIVGDWVELCLGQLELPRRLYQHHRGAAWKCFVTADQGVIRRLPSAQDIQRLHGVQHVWLHREQGDTVGGLDSNYSWIVQVMCTGNDQPDAKRNAARAIEFVAGHTVIG
ncbi:ATP-grasp domain-containing protein [Azohydromonas caseinilytica]|uniref:ATP-grasp domain-containing protein n=1 Tax=Azohydromonas caseinilytica TaxID=2728836 RepID=A0A848FIE5_9BURK|nr:ATP-grasp domain-containing protein [Azohydromonas caseinilytica]NML18023.1 ATP-grasp domain-containing protein [Azohydromonas caseinilytica]